MGAPLVLALDLATRSGWALGREQETPRWGVWDLGSAQNGGQGRRLSCLANEIEAVIAVHQPERAVFEAPLVRHDKATRLLTYLCGVVEMVCFEHSLPCEPGNVNSARSMVLGHGFPKSTDPRNPKLPMLLWCQRQGWDVRDDNAADALVLLRYFEMKRAEAKAKAAANRERLL